MPLKGPLPITDRRRKQLFDPQSIVPTRMKRTIKPRGKSLDDYYEQGKKGINLKIWTRAKKIVGKASLFKLRGLTESQIKIRQALILDNYAAQNADHMVKRLKSMNQMMLIAKLNGIEVEKLNPVQLEKALWENLFGSFIGDYARKVPGGKEMGKYISYAKRYLGVPQKVHAERARHWNTIRTIVRRLISKKVDPEKNLLNEVERVLKRKFAEGKKSIVHMRARDLIVAASIYADILMETKGVEEQTQSERERFWDHAYSEAMEKIYPKIENREEIVREIISFQAKK